MSEQSTLTVGEFTRTMDAFREEMRDRLDAIVDRQDVANGRTNALEARAAATAERLVGVDREIRDLKRRPRVDDTGSATVSISKPMIGLVIGASTALQPLLAALLKALGLLQ